MKDRKEKVMKKAKGCKIVSLLGVFIFTAITIFLAVTTVLFVVRRGGQTPTNDSRPWANTAQIELFFAEHLSIYENFQTICGIVLGATVIFLSLIFVAYFAYKFFRTVQNNQDPTSPISVKAFKTFALVSILAPIVAIIFDYIGLLAEHALIPDVVLHIGRGIGLYVIIGLLAFYLVINIIVGILGFVLIKKIKNGKLDDLKPVAQTESAEEVPAVEEVAEEVAEEPEEIEEPAKEVPVAKAEAAAAEEGETTIGYDRSFTGKLTQTKDETKLYYSAIKNALLSYKGKGKKVSDRISWKYETFNVGRNKVAKLKVKGKTLCIYLALDPKAYADTKYKVEDVSGSKADESTNLMYRITNARRAKYVLTLIADAMAKYDLTYVEGENVNYVKGLKAKSDKQLVKAGLAKEVAVTSFPRK